MTAYSSASPRGVPVVVRASSNEAPGPTPLAIVDAARGVLAQSWRYPVLGAQDLIHRIAEYAGVDQSHVLAGEGALALLDRTLLAFVRPGDHVVIAWRSYEAYPLSIRVAGATPVLVPLDPGGHHDLDAMLRAITTTTRAVIVCNPNNPTGTVVSSRRLAAFVHAVPRHVVVIIDEAYIEFADDTSGAAPADLEWLALPNVVVLRTFSKAHALAGLRVGYLLAHPTLAADVRCVMPPFPVSTPAVAAAVCSLDHPEFLATRVATVRHERGRLVRYLAARRIRHLPSMTNFVWLPLGRSSQAFADACGDAGVLVRPFPNEGVRVTVGDDRLLDRLEPVLAVRGLTDPA
jgi:histidinol-phosphate aminotransferase